MGEEVPQLSYSFGDSARTVQSEEVPHVALGSNGYVRPSQPLECFKRSPKTIEGYFLNGLH